MAVDRKARLWVELEELITERHTAEIIYEQSATQLGRTDLSPEERKDIQEQQAAAHARMHRLYQEINLKEIDLREIDPTYPGRYFDRYELADRQEWARQVFGRGRPEPEPSEPRRPEAAAGGRSDVPAGPGTGGGAPDRREPRPINIPDHAAQRRAQEQARDLERQPPEPEPTRDGREDRDDQDDRKPDPDDDRDEPTPDDEEHGRQRR